MPKACALCVGFCASRVSKILSEEIINILFYFVLCPAGQTIDLSCNPDTIWREPASINGGGLFVIAMLTH